MFDSVDARSEVIARFDELYERHHPSPRRSRRPWWIGSARRARPENRAAAAQLAAIGELFGYRLSRCSETEDWAIDTEEAVAAEVGAALRISQGLAASRLRYARAMRERLPAGGRGVSGRRYRLPDVSDDRVSHRSDHRPRRAGGSGCQLAVNVARWPSMTQGRLGAQVDKIVARADADAVRRRKERHAEREIWIGDDRRGHLADSGQPVDPRRARAGQAVDRAGGHGVCARSAHPRAAPRRCAGRAGRRGGSAGLPLRAPRLRGRQAACGLAGGDSCDRRARHASPAAARRRHPRWAPTG